MKIGRRDRDMLRFEGGKGDRRSIGRIIISLKLRLTRPQRHEKVFIFLVNEQFVSTFIEDLSFNCRPEGV